MKTPWQALVGAGRYGRRRAASAWRISLSAARGAIDARRLRAQFPFLSGYARESLSLRSKLEPLYDEYVNTVSSASAAISLELAVFLTALCHAQRPRRILDLGSGFSSVVLRTYAATSQETAIVSVDDEPTWLAASRQFLANHSLNTDDLLLWDDFSAQPQAPFDLVLHDLGDMHMRQRTLPAALELLAAPPGILILDDMHKPRYARHAARVLHTSNCCHWNLHRYTADAFGRYSALAHRIGARP